MKSRSVSLGRCQWADEGGSCEKSAFRPSAIVGWRENGVPQARVGQACQHRLMHNGHDLPGLRADHREAQNAVGLRVESAS